MDATIAAAIIGVAGIIVGVILSTVINWIAGHRREVQQKQDIRRVLRWENDYNLKILDEFWRKVTREPAPEGSSEEIAFEQRLRLATIFLPTWGHLMWQSESPRLSSVLSEEEFAGSYRLHNSLDTFAARRDALQQAFDNPTARQLQADFEQWRDNWRKGGANIPQVSYARLFEFDMHTMACWQDCERIYNTAHPLGNPVRENTPHRSVRQRIGGWFSRVPKPKVSWEKQNEVPPV